MGRTRDFGLGLGIGAGTISIAVWIAGSATAVPSQAPSIGARAVAAAAIAQTIPPPCPGDVNGDRTVNAQDFVILAGNFGSDCSDVDYDGDGQSPEDGDCDDTNPTVYLGAPELCDGIDNDCDELVDEDIDNSSDPLNCGACGNVCALPNTDYSICVAGLCQIGACSVGYFDQDGLPGNGCEATPNMLDLDGDGWSPAQGDCDDADPNVNPGAPEICNFADDNCDGQMDEGPAIGCTTFFADLDGDGFGDPTDFLCRCAPTGIYNATNGSDCDDANPTIYPGAPENCFNGIDDDCDQAVDGSDPDCPPL